MDQFVRAYSTNLPKVDNIMILEYMSSSDKHNIAEIRGAKALLSSRDSYVESAVGYVEINRTQSQCIVRGKVVPEHKVSSKQYVVSALIHENDNVIAETSCDGCAASAGGCKHTLVFLSWLNKRSNEPASTSITCFWKKPTLSGVRSEPIKSDQIFGGKKIIRAERDSNVLRKFLEESKKYKNTALINSFTNINKSFNVFDMTLAYLKENNNIDFEVYKLTLDNKIKEDVIVEINKKTVDQVGSKMWHNMRQGRITASTLYEASQCATDGTLVQQILGGYKIPETAAIKRGKRLESLVIKEAEKVLNKKIDKSGFILINSLVGASPDGIGDNFVIEVKCPMSEKTMRNYVENGKIKIKFLVQIQAQMLAANKIKGVFCVADPLFEQNKKIHMHWVDLDEPFIYNIIEKSMTFWKLFIFKKIIASAMIHDS